MEMINVKLIAEPLQFTMQERNKFKISIAATNHGDETIDPELDKARLFINGEDSLQWSDTIGNGLREAKWFALPPGETVSMTWSSLASSLFPNPGTFELVLHYFDRELAPIQIQVSA